MRESTYPTASAIATTVPMIATPAGRDAPASLRSVPESLVGARPVGCPGRERSSGTPPPFIADSTMRGAATPIYRNNVRFLPRAATSGLGRWWNPGLDPTRSACLPKSLDAATVAGPPAAAGCTSSDSRPASIRGVATLRRAAAASVGGAITRVIDRGDGNQRSCHGAAAMGRQARAFIPVELNPESHSSFRRWHGLAWPQMVPIELTSCDYNRTWMSVALVANSGSTTIGGGCNHTEELAGQSQSATSSARRRYVSPCRCVMVVGCPAVCPCGCSESAMVPPAQAGVQSAPFWFTHR